MATACEAQELRQRSAASGRTESIEFSSDFNDHEQQRRKFEGQGREGAQSPNDAIERLVAASGAGDTDAAMLLIDPAVRPIFSLEVAMERAAFDCMIFEEFMTRELNGERENARLGFSVLFADAELSRIRSLRILKTTTIDDHRVVLRIHRISQSIGDDDGEFQLEQDMLAIRRESRWYLFFIAGHMRMAFSMPSENSDSQKQSVIIDSNEPLQEPEAASSPVIETLSVPIQDVHRHLEQSARSALLSEGQKALELYLRQLHTLRTRALRGDFKNLKDWRQLERADKLTIATAVRCFAQLLRNANREMLEGKPPGTMPPSLSASPQCSVPPACVCTPCQPRRLVRRLPR